MTTASAFRGIASNGARRAAALTAAVVLHTVALHSQVAYDSPRGRVEVMGLRTWTMRMLQDSIRHYVPGQELHDQACIITLRDSLHFADAAVQKYVLNPGGGPSGILISIKVVEPAERARVQWDVRRRNAFTSLRPDYAPLALAITDSAGELWPVRILPWLQFYRNDGSQSGGATDPDAVKLYAFLDAHRAEEDRRRAMQVLRDDGFWVNRMVASAVLANFGATDSTWWTLVRVLRDPHESVRGVAGMVLAHLAPRRIDWAPATADLRILLGGTNLLGMNFLMATLAQTSIAPSMAGPLLHANAEWVLASVASEHPMAHWASHQLLVELNGGIDLGQKRVDWQQWVSSR